MANLFIGTSGLSVAIFGETAVNVHDAITVTDVATGGGLPSAGPQLLPSMVTTAASKAVANDATWTADKTLLDTNLPVLLNLAAYQGSWLAWATDYAMGFVCATAAGDTTRADHYARKAVGISLSAVRDYQKGGEVSRQYLALANGSTAAFTLPDAAANIFTASLNVYTSAASWKAVTRSAATTDAVDYYQQFIAVADHADGSSPYTQDVDWQRSGDVDNNLISWITSGRKPVLGATYYVLEAAHLFASLAAFTRLSNVITLNVIPPANTAVFVEYVRTDYTQTSAGNGGLNSAFIDTGGYPSRFLGKAVASAIDWCSGHAALEAARVELSAMLVKWCDWLTANGYFHTSIQSNYGVGHYLTKACSAAVLAGTTDGDRLKSEILAYRTSTTLPQLLQLAGGFWPEGWNYGALAVDGLLVATEVMKQAGWIDGVAERSWISDVCVHLRIASSAPGIVISAGDYYATPAPMPGAEYLYFYAVQADPVKGGELASQGVLPTGWKALGYPALPTVQPPSVTSLYASGTGLTVARGGYASTDIWAYMLAGNFTSSDHQQGAPGHFEIWRGPDPLIPNCISYTKLQTPSQKTTQSNTLVVDANGNTAYQVYRFNQAFWYGTPGVVTLFETDDTDEVHTSVNCMPSYSTNLAQGAGGPVSAWVRHFLLVRSLGLVIVVDFLTVKDSSFYREFRVHVSPGAVTLSGATFTVDRGASRCFGTILSGQVLSSAQVSIATDPGPDPVPQLQFIGPAVATMAFVGVFQIGATGATFATPVYWTDGTSEGCTLGGRTFKFKADGTYS